MAGMPDVKVVLVKGWVPEAPGAVRVLAVMLHRLEREKLASQWMAGQSISTRRKKIV